jgi:accessory gene regulator B
MASKLTSGLITKKVIPTDSNKVYTYGFELLISAVINILLVMIISIAFRGYYEWILFLAAFIPLRTTAGGYHASTHMKCIIVGSIAFAVLFFICRLQIDWTNTTLLIAATSFSLLLLFSPVEARNKKLTVERRRRNRKISICIGCANLVIAIIAIFTDRLATVLNTYFAGIFAAALSMIVARIQKLHWRE